MRIAERLGRSPTGVRIFAWGGDTGQMEDGFMAWTFPIVFVNN